MFVVDDDPSVRKGLTRLLSSIGYAVESFDSALSYLEREAYDSIGCVILDVHMPGMDGLDLQSRLNASESDLPVVFLSGHGDVPSSVGAMKNGAVDFLTKPVDEQALIAAIDDALDRHCRIRQSKAADAGAQARFARLSAREFEVMRVLLGGALNKQVAVSLGISEKTVKAHRKSIMTKLEASSAAELGRICALAGIKPGGAG